MCVAQVRDQIAALSRGDQPSSGAMSMPVSRQLPFLRCMPPLPPPLLLLFRLLVVLFSLSLLPRNVVLGPFPTSSHGSHVSVPSQNVRAVGLAGRVDTASVRDSRADGGCRDDGKRQPAGGNGRRRHIVPGAGEL